VLSEPTVKRHEGTKVSVYNWGCQENGELLSARIRDLRGSWGVLTEVTFWLCVEDKQVATNATWPGRQEHAGISLKAQWQLTNSGWMLHSGTHMCCEMGLWAPAGALVP
jgi:hypothetical protein